MKYACVLLLLIGLFYLQQNTNNQINYKEGFTVPDRILDPAMKKYLKKDSSGNLQLIDEKKDKKKDRKIDMLKNDFSSKMDAKFAKLNMKECGDSGDYKGCAISSPSPPKIDFRYVNLPTTKLDPSDIYNNLSICPVTYQDNMAILGKMKSLGQYSGYTTNEYIDKTRYLDISETGPLPVNPDFFAKNGGTY